MLSLDQSNGEVTIGNIVIKPKSSITDIGELTKRKQHRIYDTTNGYRYIGFQNVDGENSVLIGIHENKTFVVKVSVSVNVREALNIEPYTRPPILEIEVRKRLYY